MILNLQKMIAYKDLEKSQCYLERMKDSESGPKIQSQSQSSKMRDEPRTMYVPDNSLSKYEVWEVCIAVEGGNSDVSVRDSLSSEAKIA